MEEFSILQVIVTSELEDTYSRYLNFSKFPEIRVVDKLSASTLLPRKSDAHNHGKVFLEQLQEGGPLARGFLKKHDAVGVGVRLIHYSGEFATSMVSELEHVGSVTISPVKP